jgi:hypothetical protein
MIISSPVIRPSPFIGAAGAGVIVALQPDCERRQSTGEVKACSEHHPIQRLREAG